MAQNIGKRRGKSPTQVTLEQKLKAKRRDPEGYKNFKKDMLGSARFVAESAAEIALLGGLGKVYKLGKHLYKVKKPKKGYKRVYRGEERDLTTGTPLNAESLRGRYYTPNIGTARDFASRGNTTTGKVFSLDLPEKQFRIGQKMAQRRAGVKFSNEVNVPKLYKDKKKLMKGQTKFVRGRAKVVKYLAPANLISEAIEKKFSKAFKQSGGLTKTVPPKRGPNPQGLKHGGTARGKGAAIRGTKFSGIY